jgi:hypothetical protein
MRESVAGIEADLERELGHDELAQLRQLLVALNGSAFVREKRKQTGQPDVIGVRSPVMNLPPTEPERASAVL